MLGRRGSGLPIWVLIWMREINTSSISCECLDTELQGQKKHGHMRTCVFLPILGLSPVVVGSGKLHFQTSKSAMCLQDVYVRAMAPTAYNHSA